MNNQELDIIRQRIGGYQFRNPDLLRQAFVRRSYSEENGGENNEVLEFIGDKVLDLIVVKLLTQQYGWQLSESDEFDPEEDYDEFACELDEAELTERKKQLVQKHYLAARIDELALAEFLITGKGDHSWDSPSVKEDLFEAILGATAIDSNWNMEVLENFVDTMLAPDAVLENPEEDVIGLVERWTARHGIGTPHYHFEKYGYGGVVMGAGLFPRAIEGVSSMDFKTTCHCLMLISDDFPPFRGYGCSRAEARRNACEVAYDYLTKNGLLHTIQDEIDDPNFNDAVSQLEILARRGYFSIPVYDFTETHDENGNPVWHCVCRVKEKGQTFTAVSSSKKQAKKQAAWDMLQFILT